MELSAWLDIVSLLFLISISLLCYRQGVLWPIFLLLGSAIAHVLATDPDFKQKINTALPALERALPLTQTIPVVVFIVTLLFSHYLAHYAAARLERSAVRGLGTVNRFLGAICGLLLGCSIIAWTGRFASYHFPSLAPHIENSAVITWCSEQEEKYNFSGKLVILFRQEAKKIADILTQ